MTFTTVEPDESCESASEGVDPQGPIAVIWALGCTDYRVACAAATPVFQSIPTSATTGVLGGTEITIAVEIKLETDWGEPCVYVVSLMNANDEYDYRPGFFSSIGVSERDETTGFIETELTIDTNNDRSIGRWEFAFRVTNAADLENHSSETFGVGITCDSDHRSFPMTPGGGTKCPNDQYEWCSNNYMEDAEQVHCSDFNNCLREGDGNG